MDEVDILKRRIKELENVIFEEQRRNALTPRERIEHMSSEVIDSNPYR